MPKENWEISFMLDYQMRGQSLPSLMLFPVSSLSKLLLTFTRWLMEKLSKLTKVLPMSLISLTKTRKVKGGS